MTQELLLVHDERRAVALHTLPPGTRFKMPNWPEVNIEGTRGKLLYAHESRCLVQLDCKVAPQEEEGEDGEKLTRKGRSYTLTTNVGANTMVIPLIGRDDAVDELLAREAL